MIAIFYAFLIYVKKWQTYTNCHCHIQTFSYPVTGQALQDKNFNSYSIVSAEGLFFAGGISQNSFI
jgi:hypothetical protein